MCKTINYMQWENVLNAKILAITINIQSRFPELYNYLDEMTVTIPNAKDPEINIINLKNYFNSLEVMFKKYSLTHVCELKIPES